MAQRRWRISPRSHARADRVAHEIADILASFEVHGIFTVRYVEDEGPGKIPELWCEWKAQWAVSRIGRDVGDLLPIALAFLEPLQAAGYDGDTRTLARMTMTPLVMIGQTPEQREQVIHDWRYLGRTELMAGVVHQVAGYVKTWGSRKHYLAATGFAVQILVNEATF